jgi:hypothetical protein
MSAAPLSAGARAAAGARRCRAGGRGPCLRLDHGAHALAAAGLGAGAVGAAGDEVLFEQRIVGNELAAHFVEPALDPRAVEELGLFGPGVVLDALGFPFDVAVLAFALLAEARQRAAAAGGDAALVAVIVLDDDDAFGADDQGALGPAARCLRRSAPSSRRRP